MKPSALIAKNISCYYENKAIFEQLNIAIADKKISAIMGPSGAGKSSLLNILSGQVIPDMGKVTWQNKALTSQKKPLPFGILFQNNALLLHLSVFENIALGLRYAKKLNESTIKEQVMQRLTEVGLEDAAELYPEQLSGGMARRVAIARATIAKPKIMFFDEPFSGLDPPNSALIAKLIKKVSTRLQATTIIVTHEPYIALALCDEIYLLHEQKIYTHGSPNEIKANKDQVVQSFIQPKIEHSWGTY
mgnify:CR=1 FL=1